MADSRDPEAYIPLDLAGADLSYTNWRGAYLSHCNFAEANLEGANLAGSILAFANLEGANLAGANLEGASLLRANLEGANLAGANLAGAGLIDANVAGANLREADIRGATLHSIYRNIERYLSVQFGRTKADLETIWPFSFTPELELSGSRFFRVNGLVQTRDDKGRRLMDISDFPSWAVGNLVDNRNRGIFAEWLVGQALGAINPGEVRKEWDAVDLRYRGMGVEIKASGLSQTWNSANTSTPRFDIHKQLQWWDADTDTWGLYDPPQRTADVYVFCLHEAVPATDKNVADPSQWRFWVISTAVLNSELGSQKSVGVTTLNELAESVSFPEIKSAVEKLV